MNTGIILAGGMGMRMGTIDKPKQFIDIYGKPILVHTVEMFDSHPEIDSIAIVSLSEWHDEIRAWVRKYELNKVKWIVEGGKTRQRSVYNGLKTISEIIGSEDIVIVHDAVRPLITHKTITDNIKGAALYGAVDTVIPAHDTIIKSADNKTIDIIPSRRELFIGQTPQSFKFSILFKAHQYAHENNIIDATDDCQLVINCGNLVYLVEGDKLNFKITTSEDLLLLKSIIKLGKLERI